MELPHIGQNCVVCNRNDYLPFKCSHCDKIVCVDHKSNHGDECPLNKGTQEFQTSGGPQESLKQACDYCRKITLKLELTQCNYCNNNHCLYHRHQVQHKCPQLAKDQESREKEELDRSRRQREALDRLKDINKQQTTSTTQQTADAATKKTSGPQPPSIIVDPKKRALAKRIRIMKIKQSARGPPNILDQDRIYFEVKFQHEPKSTLSDVSKDGKTIRIYSTGKHPVGRMIDWSASEMDLTNKNHVEKADQLIFKVQKRADVVQSNKDSSESGLQSEMIILDSHVTFEHYLNSNELEDGDELLLTYSPTNS